LTAGLGKKTPRSEENTENCQMVFLRDLGAFVAWNPMVGRKYERRLDLDRGAD
jgi:hypothetical protein